MYCYLQKDRHVLNVLLSPHMYNLHLFILSNTFLVKSIQIGDTFIRKVQPSQRKVKSITGVSDHLVNKTFLPSLL